METSDLYGFRGEEKNIAEILDILRFPRGNESFGFSGSGLQFDSDSKTIIVNEDALLRAIMLVNRGQMPRKIRVLRDEEFRKFREERSNGVSKDMKKPRESEATKNQGLSVRRKLKIF